MGVYFFFNSLVLLLAKNGTLTLFRVMYLPFEAV